MAEILTYLPDELFVSIFCACSSSVDMRNLKRACRRLLNISKEQCIRTHMCKLKLEELKKTREPRKALRWAFYQGCSIMIELMLPDIRSGIVDLDYGITGAVKSFRIDLIRRYTSISFRRSLFQSPNTLSRAIKPYVCTSKLIEWRELLYRERDKNIRSEATFHEIEQISQVLMFVKDLLTYEIQVGRYMARHPIVYSVGSCFHVGCPNSIDLVDDEFVD